MYAVSYTHLDVYKRQVVGLTHSVLRAIYYVFIFVLNLSLLIVQTSVEFSFIYLDPLFTEGLHIPHY